MPGMELLAAGGFGAKATFNYNRDNFMYDREMRMKKEFQLMDFKCEQAGQWREDVRDLISLTEYKMHVYLLVNVLMLGFTVVLWCEGRLPETTPDWMMMGSALSITGSFMFLLLSIWMAMHAAVAAQGYETRLLTQLVRLPIPTWQELEACRTCGSDFEKLDPKQMFRVPFVQGRQEDMMNKSAAAAAAGAEASASGQPFSSVSTAGQPFSVTAIPPESADRVPACRQESPSEGQSTSTAAARAADPWGLERSGDDIYELGTREGSEIARLRHIKLARQAMVYWQTYDAFARVSMSIGVIELLLAMSYYVLGYVLVQDGCRTAATYGVILLTVMAESICRMDMSLPLWESRLVQFLLFVCPVMSCVAACHWSTQSNFSLKLAEGCIVVAFFSHGLFLALMTYFCRISEQDNGTLLPVAFRSVLYLDVFGWLRGTEGLEDSQSPTSPAGRRRFMDRSRRAAHRAQTQLWMGNSSVWAVPTRRGGGVSMRRPGFHNAERTSALDTVAEDEYYGHDDLRPSTECVHYNDDGSAVPQRPEDAAPHGIQQDFRNERGAPQGTFHKDAKAFFSPANWMHGEASKPSDRCSCGNIFMDDALFCRRCGEERLVGDDEALPPVVNDDLYATGHESHNPGILPWRVFSSVMVLLCLAWLLGGVYHLLSLTNMISKDEPLVWEVEHPGSDEPWERELPRPDGKKAVFLMSLFGSKVRRSPFSVKVPERLEGIETLWPHSNVKPHSLACDTEGRHFVVADKFRTYAAAMKGDSSPSARKRGSKQRRLGLAQLRNLREAANVESADFRELECHSLLGEGLLDAAVTCGSSASGCDGAACGSDSQSGPLSSGVCQALVLHRHGRRMSACPLEAPAGSAKSSQKGGFVANLSDAWLEVSRRDQEDDTGLSIKGRGPHSRVEKTVAFSIDPSCWSGTGALPRRCAGAFAGTSKGRVVQLQQHSHKEELVPAEVLAEGGSDAGLSSLSSGAVRALGGGYLGILEDGGKTIQVLDLKRGGVHAGKIRLPESRPAAAFCAGGGDLWLLGEGASPSLQRVPLPAELLVSRAA